MPEAECGIRWLTGPEIARATREFDADTDDHLGLYDELHSYTATDLRGDAAKRIPGCMRMGVGAPGGRFVALARELGSVSEYPAEFWYDPAAPDGLFCSLNGDCPPHLWFPVGRTPESIVEATAAYFSGRPADPPETGGRYAARIRNRSPGREVPDDWVTTRVLLGLTTDISRDENRFTFRPAFCRNFDAIATGPEEDRNVPETVFHTLQSFSRVRIELHSWLRYAAGAGETASPMVAELTYPACGHGDLIGAYNAAKDTDVPLDVPVDVLAALFGYPIKGLPRFYRVMNPDSPPADITYTMGLIVATEGHDPTLMAFLREYARHSNPQVRARVGRYAHMTGHDELVREILSVERNSAARKELVGILGEDEDSLVADRNDTIRGRFQRRPRIVC